MNFTQHRAYKHTHTHSSLSTNVPAIYLFEVSEDAKTSCQSILRNMTFWHHVVFNFSFNPTRLKLHQHLKSRRQQHNKLLKKQLNCSFSCKQRFFSPIRTGLTLQGDVGKDIFTVLLCSLTHRSGHFNHQKRPMRVEGKILPDGLHFPRI